MGPGGAQDFEHPRGPEQFRRDGGGLQHLGRRSELGGKLGHWANVGGEIPSEYLLIKGIPPPTEYTPLKNNMEQKPSFFEI